MKIKNEISRTGSHSPYQIGRATASNFKPANGGQGSITSNPGSNNVSSAGRPQLNNQSSDKSIHGRGTASGISGVGGAATGMGIDMSKLKQLKAYQPPKLDYLAQMKYAGANSGQQNRANLISADATNLSHNPRLALK